MADMEPGKISAEQKLAEELGVIARFLDTELKPRAEAAAKSAQWSWRKTIAFVFVTGLIGWSLVLGLAYLLFRLLD